MTREVTWCGKVPERDSFHEPIVTTFIAVPMRCRWGFFTLDSWYAHGVGKLGLGYGQRYEKQTDGRWLRVEGF